MKKRLLLIILTVLLLYVNAQNITNKYCFVNKYQFYLDSTKTGNYESEYCYERDYLNDSVFVEKGLFGSLIPNEYLFKVKLNYWYINNNGKWYPFFNENINLVSDLKIGNYNYTVSWKKICNCIDDDLFLMTISISPKFIGGGEKEDYYFHPKYGIIGFKTSFYSIIRKDILDKNINSCIPFYTTPNIKRTNINNKYGLEYLGYPLIGGVFRFWNNQMSNKEQVDKGLILNRLEPIYINHFLYCLDTINNYVDFVNRSNAFFKNGFSVAWGMGYSDFISSDTVSTDEFAIIKYNTIHGASLIVNSCLFYKGIYNEEDKFYLYKKYFLPNWNKQLLNDSIMNEMYVDIERLCVKVEKCD
jgi:hypothetical protein